MSKISSIETNAANKPTKLKPIQLKAMDLILSGTSLQDVARELQVGRQTISEWKNKNPIFKAKLEELRAEAEEELHYAIPMHNSYMIGQLRKLAAEGPHESRLKAVQLSLEIFWPKEVAADLPAGLNPTEALIFQAIKRLKDSGGGQTARGGVTGESTSP